MKSRKGYKRLYDESYVLKNIDTIYTQCTLEDINNGKTWYESAKSFSIYLSKKYNVPEIKTAGVIAALSPQKAWDQNKILAESFIETNGNSKGHVGVQLIKAKIVLKQPLLQEEVCNTLGGLKTINFFKNIYNPECKEAVTIDRHHLNVCYAEDLRSCTDKQYEFLKKNTIIFANKVNMIPSELQATLWVCWKRIKKSFVWQN